MLNNDTPFMRNSTTPWLPAVRPTGTVSIRIPYKPERNTYPKPSVTRSTPFIKQRKQEGESNDQVHIYILHAVQNNFPTLWYTNWTT